MESVVKSNGPCYNTLMETIAELYGRDEIRRLDRKWKRSAAIAIVIALAGVAACVALCLLTNTANAAQTERAAIAASTVSACVSTYVATFFAAARKREYGHAEMLRGGERAAVPGPVTVTDERLRIRGSIAIRRVLVPENGTTRRLSVSESKADALKALGPDITLYTVGSYVAGYAKNGEGGEPLRSRAEWRPLRNIFSQLLIYLALLVLCAMFWGWIFTFVTDTSAEKKVTLFVDAYALEDTALAVRLERDMPEGLRMIKVHPVSYVMFDESIFLDADLFIVRSSGVEDYIDAFAPLPEAAGEADFRYQGVPYGMKVYDAATGEGAAAAYIRYAVGGIPAEDYYLFFGTNSLHTGSYDDAAFAVAAELMDLK